MPSSVQDGGESIRLTCLLKFSFLSVYEILSSKYGLYIHNYIRSHCDCVCMGDDFCHQTESVTQNHRETERIKRFAVWEKEEKPEEGELVLR